MNRSSKEAVLNQAIDRVARLSIWSESVNPQPITGGITNQNFMVSTRDRKYFVRVGEDNAEHGIMRFNERAIARAAGDCGISPRLIHAEQGILVTDFIEGRTLEETDLQNEDLLVRAVDLVSSCHHRLRTAAHGPLLMFWVFHIIDDYLRKLRAAGRLNAAEAADFERHNRELEGATGAVEVTLCHNDLLPANFIDDGDRLWLVDWEYGGFNTALFDLGGLTSNSGLTQAAEQLVLARYYGMDRGPREGKRLAGMKCASLLRETLWSMISEIYSSLDFDYAQYTEGNLARFRKAYAEFRQLQ